MATCAVQGAFDDACATGFIQQFGLRVFRRPVAPDELGWLQGVYQNIKTLSGVTPPTAVGDEPVSTYRLYGA